MNHLRVMLMTFAIGSILSATAFADDTTTISVMLKDHRFNPSEIHVPAGKRAQITIKNEDAQAEEFDSSALKIEKVIGAGETGTVRIHPLAAGHYPFKGEYHEETAQGAVIAE